MFRNHKITRPLLSLAIAGIIAAITPACISTSGGSSRVEPFTFIQMCDPQLGIVNYEQDMKKFSLAVKQINDLQPDFVVICGDLVGSPDKHTFTDFNTIREQLTVPCYCVPGNHDVGNQPTTATIARYRKEVGKDYYSFTNKGYLFLCINTQLLKAPLEGESEAQETWLKASLQSAVKESLPVFIIGHHPLYSKTPDEAEEYGNLPILKRKELLDLFEKSGVVAVVTGHAHKILINDHNGMQLVTGETTSRTHGSPLGFRIWHIAEPRPFVHESVLLQELSTGVTSP